MRRAARVDTNHAAIVAALRAAGASIVSLASLGHGVPDLLVCGAGWCRLIEIKTPTGKLTSDQVAFAAHWQGPPVVIVRSVDEAMAWWSDQPD
jgi:hypothetical protein